MLYLMEKRDVMRPNVDDTVMLHHCLTSVFWQYFLHYKTYIKRFKSLTLTCANLGAVGQKKKKAL